MLSLMAYGHWGSYRSCSVWRINPLNDLGKGGGSLGDCLTCLGRLIILSSQSFLTSFSSKPAADQDRRFLSFHTRTCYSFKDEEIKISVVSVRSWEQTGLQEGNGSGTGSTGTTETASVMFSFAPEPREIRMPIPILSKSRSQDLSIQPNRSALPDPRIQTP